MTGTASECLRGIGTGGTSSVTDSRTNDGFARPQGSWTYRVFEVAWRAQGTRGEGCEAVTCN